MALYNTLILCTFSISNSTLIRRSFGTKTKIAEYSQILYKIYSVFNNTQIYFRYSKNLRLEN